MLVFCTIVIAYIRVLVHIFSLPNVVSFSLILSQHLEMSSSLWMHFIGFVAKSWSNANGFTWIYQTESPSAGYNLIGSLYRAGPVPFFQRIVNADSYEQAVLKYMAQEGCDRVVSGIYILLVLYLCRFAICDLPSDIFQCTYARSWISQTFWCTICWNMLGYVWIDSTFYFTWKTKIMRTNMQPK